MATSQLPDLIFRPPSLHRRTIFRQCHPTSVFLTPPKNLKTKTLKSGKKFKWVIYQSLVDKQSPIKNPITTVDMNKLVEFLYEDLPHLFDDKGIDRKAYDDYVKFRDPITKHDSIDGYLFNISMLKLLFRPDFQLHWAKQTGPYEITTRWTMVMKFILLPWKPELVFTGTSVMGINPKTNKFNSHVDYWDSIQNNDYFSLEGLLDVIKQLRIYKTPDLGTPSYQILRRTGTYEGCGNIFRESELQRFPNIYFESKVVGALLFHSGGNDKSQLMR